METLFDKIFEVLSLEYMITVILASYSAIKIIDYFNKDRVVPTWLKRVVTFIVGIIGIVVFTKFTDVGIKCLITSYFVAIFAYDTAIKFILKKLDIDYKK